MSSPRETGTPPPDGQDALARLIRSAGRREPVPAERAARVKLAVRAQWQRSVQARRIRVWGAWGGAAVAALLALAVIPSFIRSGPPLASVEVASAGTAIGTRALKSGDALAAGDVIATTDGRAALKMSSGQSLRLDVGTRLKIESAQVVALESGAVYIDTERAGKKALTPIEVRTPFGNTRNEGTQFEVRLGADSVTVRVREGKVVLKRGEQTSTASAGVELASTASGSIAKRDLPPSEANWNWAIALAPAFEIEGATLHSYLKWVCREQGWTLQLAPEVQSIADGTILRGSIAGLTPQESLVVLATAGVKHRVEKNVLFVQK
jgi:hypothetical protein